MEHVRIAIVGAGPAGLTLGVALAKLGLKSVILEREAEIADDPRGVYLAADAVRILYNLGLGKYMPIIGHELQNVQFHRSTFAQEPFHEINLIHDDFHQAVPNGILQIQPCLEGSLRKVAKETGLCELRLGCDVQSLEEVKDGVQIQYKDQDGNLKTLLAAWIVGADGKTGVVRKTFLEKAAGIRQVKTGYQYEGTWVAANIRIKDPTPETHPNLPFWNAGMSPEDVYDLYWPKGWHFCSPPGKPTAAGRFGPYEARLWRHEFRQDDWDPSTMDAEALFWEHITPMITRASSSDGINFPNGPVMFPRDCIEVLRCRPFKFTHKVVNRWFSGRSILIGDAAHVFPPFGGQGIASGIRDAHQLAWRLAILERQPQDLETASPKILEAWAHERTQGITDAANLTRVNGLLCNQDFWFATFLLQVLQWLVKTLLPWNNVYDPQVETESRGYCNVSNGFHLAQYGGGRKLPQIYINTLSEMRMLSDNLLSAKGSVFKLLLLAPSNTEAVYKVSDVTAEFKAAEVPDCILSAESVCLLSLIPVKVETLGHYSEKTNKAAPTALRQLPDPLTKSGYTTTAMQDRLGPRARFVIMRPDFYIFAVAKDLTELQICLRGLTARCAGR